MRCDVCYSIEHESFPSCFDVPCAYYQCGHDNGRHYSTHDGSHSGCIDCNECEGFVKEGE